MAMRDLTVMGAGVFGLAAAWEAARRGARVRVIDPGGVGAGASGGLVGALSPHAPEGWNDIKAFQLDALLMAEGWWAEVAEAAGLPTGYARLGRVQPLMDEKAVETARRRVAGAADLWHGAAEWRVVPASGPFAPLSPTGLVVEDTLSARLHPRMACAALAAAIRAAGGTIETEGEAEGPVLWASGAAGLADLGAALGREMGGGVKGQALSLRLDAGDAPQIYAPGLHVVPHAGGTVAVGSTSERDYDRPDTTDAQLDVLHARAVVLCPWLEGAPVVARWAGLRPRAATPHPLMGAWPGRDGHYVANGGFRIGFALAPKVAGIMADLILDGRDGIPDAFQLV